MTLHRNDEQSDSASANLRRAIIDAKSRRRFEIAPGPVTSAAMSAVAVHGPTAFSQIGQIAETAAEFAGDIARQAARLSLRGAAAGHVVARRLVAEGVSAANARLERRKALDAIRVAETRRPRGPKPSGKVQKIWRKQLEDLGESRVQDLLERESVLDENPNQLIRFVDAGVTQGVHRFPTRSFVETWLYGAPEGEDHGTWRILAVVVLVVAFGALGLLGAGGMLF